ncbi:hypothetical protein [Bacillus toyonensis]|uniref:hypothetical protein n=1 Tax=Bacillus toyonensis TaxID=155322 RepID=UPI000B449BF2|nr:hypothetical protein [Bacillus toyonensis]MED3200963.1 hypothetical protein [Bacillus toyonensis]OTX10817.1 hypothetical protein BK712_04380 [Bacillus thuringiensis serovar seoulensis]
MRTKEYEMSEKAFLDIWQEFGCPEELYDEEQCYEFLKMLNERTQGLIIVDHFSNLNYDHISRVDFKDGYLYVYWKDFIGNPIMEEFKDIFGPATYIYSLCHLRKLKFINHNGHLYILFMPNVSKVKEVKKILSIEKIKLDQELLIKEDIKNLNTRFTFIKDGHIHECIIHDLPFYSFLIQPKQGGSDIGFSKKLLLIETLRFTIERLMNARKTLHNTSPKNYDGIRGVGNTVRNVLESVVKYYCICMGYSLPKEHYGNNMLGDLKKHLSAKEDEELAIYLDQETINIANNLSHDDGKVYSVKVVDNLCAKALKIIEAIFNVVMKKEY